MRKTIFTLSSSVFVLIACPTAGAIWGLSQMSADDEFSMIFVLAAVFWRLVWGLVGVVLILMAHWLTQNPKRR